MMIIILSGSCGRGCSHRVSENDEQAVVVQLLQVGNAQKYALQRTFMLRATKQNSFLVWEIFFLRPVELGSTIMIIIVFA